MTNPPNDSTRTPVEPSVAERHRQNTPAHGHLAFSDYLRGVQQSEGAPVASIPRLDLGIALGGSLLLVALGFAPWIEYRLRSGEDGHRIGLATDGVFAVIAAVVAAIALIVAARRGPGGGDFESLIAFGATLVAIVATGFTLMYVDGFPIDNVVAGSLKAGWGMITAMIVSLVTSLFCFRVMRAASVF